jgi:hypothetical protein
MSEQLRLDVPDLITVNCAWCGEDYKINPDSPGVEPPDADEELAYFCSAGCHELALKFVEAEL